MGAVFIPPQHSSELLISFVWKFCSQVLAAVMASRFSFSLCVVVLISFSCQNMCQGRHLYKRHHDRQRDPNVEELLLTYQMDSLGSGATNMRLIGTEGDQNNIDQVLGAVGGTTNGLSVGNYDISDAQIAQGRQSLEPFQLDAQNNNFQTSVSFGFPIRTQYPLSEAQKRSIYRKTIELCRMIRHKLARTMNVDIECSFPAETHL